MSEERVSLNWSFLADSRDNTNESVLTLPFGCCKKGIFLIIHDNKGEDRGNTVYVHSVLLTNMNNKI